MRRVQLVAACLAQPEAVEEFPFGDDISVFKVGGKVFALVPVAERTLSISLKCDPDRAISLRMQYSAVTGGYHLNKRHWNTVVVNGSIPENELDQWVEDSYDLVVDGLRKLDRLRLQGQVLALPYDEG